MASKETTMRIRTPRKYTPLSPETKIGYVILKEEFFIQEESTNRCYWKCICECGKEITRRADHLKRKQDRLCSCGCKHPSKTSLGKNSLTWRGAGEIPGQYFSSLKHSAKKRKINFDITIEYIWDLFLKQKRLCSLTHLPLDFLDSRRHTTVEQTASLDRIDSKKGYEVGNVQWVHKDVNRMKNGYTQERFFEICKLIVENNLIRQNYVDSCPNSTNM